MNWKYCLSVPPGFSVETLRKFSGRRVPIFLEPAANRILVGGRSYEAASEEAADLRSFLSARGIAALITPYEQAAQ